MQGYTLEVEDRFDGPDLDTSLWLPHHLPHWSSWTASAARYRLGDGLLRLVVEEDQPPWCPEFDGQVRVSSLQTGDTAGQHRFAASDVGREHSAVGMGVHPFGDPTITDEFAAVPLPIDATEFHEYAAEWTPERIRFLVDDEQVKQVEQSSDYPMQFMFGVYAFPDAEGGPPPGPYPKEFVVDRFRGYRRPASSAG